MQCRQSHLPSHSSTHFGTNSQVWLSMWQARWRYNVAIKWFTMWLVSDMFHQPEKSFVGCTNPWFTVSLFLRMKAGFYCENKTLSFTPAITSSIYTLRRCRRQSRRETWSARDEKWVVSSSVMENTSAVWRRIFSALHRTACGFLDSVFGLRPKHMQTACIMPSWYKSSTQWFSCNQLSL